MIKVIINGKEVVLNLINRESGSGVTNYSFETNVPEIFGVQISVAEEDDPINMEYIPMREKN